MAQNDDIHISMYKTSKIPNIIQLRCSLEPAQGIIGLMPCFASPKTPIKLKIKQISFGKLIKIIWCPFCQLISRI